MITAVRLNLIKLDQTRCLNIILLILLNLIDIVEGLLDTMKLLLLLFFLISCSLFSNDSVLESRRNYFFRMQIYIFDVLIFLKLLFIIPIFASLTIECFVEFTLIFSFGKRSIVVYNLILKPFFIW